MRTEFDTKCREFDKRTCAILRNRVVSNYLTHVGWDIEYRTISNVRTRLLKVCCGNRARIRRTKFEREIYRSDLFVFAISVPEEAGDSS